MILINSTNFIDIGTKLRTTLPSFKKGIKIEIKNGIDNSKYPCKMELCISD